MIAINTNMSAMRANSALQKAQSARAVAAERLSKGIRLNSASDDAAGLAISISMTSQIRGYAQAVRNIADGVSLAQSAQGVLQGMTESVQRIRELSVQAANGSLSDEQRNHIQSEVSLLRESAMDALIETQFNGDFVFGEKVPLPPPLSGNVWTPASIKIQSGPNETDVITTSISLGFLPTFDVSTQTAAKTAINSADQSISDISNAAALFGALENRLHSAARTGTNAKTNLADARSRILDADYAAETTQLAKQEILANASAAMLSMANAQASNVLTLLKT